LLFWSWIEEVARHFSDSIIGASFIVQTWRASSALVRFTD
jgi:hypothetical protein